MKAYPIRLYPDQDLKKELNFYFHKMNLKAAFVISCCGSLKKLKIRLADSSSVFERTEKFEILSLQGTISENGAHLHICAADSEGKVWGGHLVDGCEVYTTAEILIAELSDYHFNRENDSQTGFAELKIKKVE